MLEARDEVAKEKRMEAYIEEKCLKVYISEKREVNEYFIRKINQDVNGYKRLFPNEVVKANGGKVESCSRIKDISDRLSMEEGGSAKDLKDYYEDLYNIDNQEEVGFRMYSFYGVQRSNYIGGEPIKRIEVEVRMKKLKNGKASGKDEVTGETVKGGGDMVVDWISR